MKQRVDKSFEKNFHDLKNFLKYIVKYFGIESRESKNFLKKKKKEKNLQIRNIFSPQKLDQTSLLIIFLKIFF